MQIKNSNDKGVLVLSLFGRLTMDSEELLVERVKKVADGGARRLLVDLSGVDYVDSHGLGQMVAAHNLLGSLGGQIRFAGVSSKLQALLEMTHLPRVLHVDANRETSVAKLRGS